MSMGLNYLEAVCSPTVDEDENVELDISDFKDIEALLKDEEEIQEERIKYEILNTYLDKKENKYKHVTRRIDNNKIRHKTVKNFEVCTSILKNVKIEGDGPIRSGVIVYTHYGGKTYFCLGIDSCYGDLTDFSGGKKQGETVIEGGLRELEEESLGVFGKISVNEVNKFTGFYSSNMLIMFIKREVDMDLIRKNFRYNHHKRMAANPSESLEVSDLVWLDTKDLVASIQGKGSRLYSRVRKILSKVVPVIEAI